MEEALPGLSVPPLPEACCTEGSRAAGCWKRPVCPRVDCAVSAGGAGVPSFFLASLNPFHSTKTKEGVYSLYLFKDTDLHNEQKQQRMDGIGQIRCRELGHFRFLSPFCSLTNLNSCCPIHSLNFAGMRAFPLFQVFLCCLSGPAVAHVFRLLLDLG